MSTKNKKLKESIKVEKTFNTSRHNGFTPRMAVKRAHASKARLNGTSSSNEPTSTPSATCIHHVGKKIFVFQKKNGRLNWHF
jgi:hypothetical protein